MLCHEDWYWFLATRGPGKSFADIDPAKLPHQLRALVGVQQSPEHHPEGDAFVHTGHVVDAMASILSREGIAGDRRVVFMLAAVCHDMGKATHTRWDAEKQKWTAYGHDVAGVHEARRFLEGIGTYPEVVREVLPLVRWHMTHCRSDFTPRAVRKLARELQPVTIADLVLLLEADCAGRPPIPPGLPPAVTEKLVPIARDNGWLNGPDPADDRR